MVCQSEHTAQWQECLRLIEGIIEPQKFKTWFTPIKPLDFKDGTLTIEVPSDFFRDILETEYIDIIRMTLRRVYGPEVKLIYSIHPVMGSSSVMKIPSGESPVRNEQSIRMPISPIQGPMNPFVLPGLKKFTVNSRLEPKYNFEALVKGECNKIAVVAGENIASAPGKTPFNPLFIFGGSGLGKTHIAHAIGNRIADKFPELVVLYMTGNEFKTKYVDAVAIQNKLTDFMAFFSRMDVLIVDDVQDLLGQGSQNAFFNIFNALHQSGKQLIFTSDRSPSELKNFEERLLSRFKWGLSVELRRPEYSTRLAMLRKRCELEGAEIDESVLEFIADRVRSNFRELEGVLVSLIAHATFAHSDVTLELAERVTSDLVSENLHEITINKVENAVCDYFAINLEALHSNTRKRQIVQARQIAMYLCRNHIEGISLSTIGSQIGGKDHATVLHSCNTVSDLISTDRCFRQYVNDIEKIIEK